MTPSLPLSPWMLFPKWCPGGLVLITHSSAWVHFHKDTCPAHSTEICPNPILPYFPFFTTLEAILFLLFISLVFYCLSLPSTDDSSMRTEHLPVLNEIDHTSVFKWMTELMTACVNEGINEWAWSEMTTGKGRDLFTCTPREENWCW